MPNISSLTMPDGIVYAIKDSQARKDIEEIKKNSSAGSGGSSGGGGVFVVNGTFNEGSQTKGTVDKTDAEIFEAANSGKMVHFCINQDGTAFVYNLTQYEKMPIPDGTFFYMFICAGFDSGYVETFTFGGGEFERESYHLSDS